jgi:hypothetical protein
VHYKDKHHCPKCGTAIFDRAFSLCGHCHAELPAELLYSEAERAAMRVSATRSGKLFDRVSRIGFAMLFGALWVGAVWATWKRPEDWWFLLGGAAAITLYVGMRRWAELSDDGLNPALRHRKKEPNKSPQLNAGSGPATLDSASPPRPALSSEEMARP